MKTRLQLSTLCFMTLAVVSVSGFCFQLFIMKGIQKTEMPFVKAQFSCRWRGSWQNAKK